MNTNKNNLTLGGLYSGFAVKEIIYVSEAAASIYQLEHLKSGAKLLYLDKNDDNKVFSAAFKTIPEDSTGVFHILEHSVLCGSEKYPVKEPFVDLIKGSMQTFLNAFTFPDKTMYPCASCNDRDFANLMSVYLDAVFAPAIYKHPEIFKQEGWHVELLDKDAPAEYKGVVYNEMKGSFSSVDTRLYGCIDKALFPDNLYRHSSGGFPPAITDLTYEQFINAHRKYYHPENSFIYLYGNMDVQEKLEFIDREYLSKYTRTGNEIKIELQKPVINKNVTETFAIAENEDEKDNYYTALSYVVETFKERETILAFNILLSALASKNESPVSKLFIDSGMAQDMWAFMYDGIAQPYAVFQLRKTNPDSIEKFEEMLIGALRDLCDKGIDKTILRAAINQTEFYLREGKQGGTPAGLSYNLDIMDGWLYGSSPELYITYEAALANIKKGLDENSRYFENLIEKYILSSVHMSKVVLIPSKTKQREDEENEKARLAELKAGLTGEQLDKLIADTKSLIAYQSASNTPEELATIPALELSDIGDGKRDMPNEISESKQIKYLYHDINTNKIAYQRWYFDISSLNENELRYCSLLTSILGESATANYNAADLGNEIQIKLGRLSFGTSVYTSVKDTNKCTPFFVVYCAALESSNDEAVRLINEILTTTVFDKNTIKTLLVQISNDMRSRFISSGDGAAIGKLRSYTTLEGAYNEVISGFSFYNFVKALINEYDARFDEIKTNLQKLCAKIFARNTMTVGYTGTRSSFENLRQLVTAGIDFPVVGYQPIKAVLPFYDGNEGICIPSGVNYCVKGCNYLENGFVYSGKMMVLSKILSSDYLWNEIRVKGGAYGTGFSASSSGSVCFHSYRDPNVTKTLAAYDRAADYLSGYSKENPDVNKYVISTVAGIDRPITPRDIGGYIENSYFSDSDSAYKTKIREEVISTTSKDIEGYAELIRLITKCNMVVTVGTASRIGEAKDEGVFDKVSEL